MKLAGLNIYPLKSGAPIALEQATLVDTGIVHDRRFMLVDANGDFVTLRGYPRLVTVGAEIGSETVAFTVGGERLEVPLESAGEDIFPVQIWGDYVDAVQVSAAADTLFSKFVGKRVRLMRFDEPERRQVAVLFKDLTARRAGELAVRESEARFRNMADNTATRSVIEHLGTYVLRRGKDHFTIFGPRSSAASLHHALITAAKSAF